MVATIVGFEAIKLKTECFLSYRPLNWGGQKEKTGRAVRRHNCWVEILKLPWRDVEFDPKKFACPLVLLSENSLDYS